MVTVEKDGFAIIFDDGIRKYAFPQSSVVAIADDNSDSVSVRLRSSRKNILCFRYGDMVPAQDSQIEAVQYIASLY